MAIDIHILGCGSATPLVDRRQSSQYIKVNEHYFLMDCGDGTQYRMQEMGLNPMKLSAIFISHLHGDHFFGLAGLLSSMHLLGRIKPLQVIGPPGLREILEIQFRYSGSFLQYELAFSEPAESESIQEVYSDGACEIFAFPLRHRIPCFGYLFKEKPKPGKIIKEKLPPGLPVQSIAKLKNGEEVSFQNEILSPGAYVYPAKKVNSYAYCSDTCFFDEINNYIAGVDVMYHESTFLEKHRERAVLTFHSTARDAATAAKKCNAGLLILGHYSARYTGVEEFLSEAKTIFDNVMLSEDKMVFSTDNLLQC